MWIVNPVFSRGETTVPHLAQRSYGSSVEGFMDAWSCTCTLYLDGVNHIDHIVFWPFAAPYCLHGVIAGLPGECRPHSECSHELSSKCVSQHRPTVVCVWSPVQGEKTTLLLVRSHTVFIERVIFILALNFLNIEIKLQSHCNHHWYPALIRYHAVELLITFPLSVIFV